MATVLRVPAFKLALTTALRARPNLKGIQVERFWMATGTSSEGIYLGNLDTNELASGRLAPSNLAGNSRARRDDDTEVFVTCQAYRAGTGVAGVGDAEDRVHALFDEVDGAIADDEDMAGSVNWSPGITWSTRIAEFERSWAIRLVASIALKTRLT